MKMVAAVTSIRLEDLDSRPRMAMYIQILTLLALLAHTSEAMVCTMGQEPDVVSDYRFRWVIPVEDPCQCTKIKLGGLNTHTPHRPFTVTYFNTYLRSSDPEEIRKWLNCPGDLRFTYMPTSSSLKPILTGDLSTSGTVEPTPTGDLSISSSLEPTTTGDLSTSSSLESTATAAIPKDCSEARGGAWTTSGVYTIKPFYNGDPIQVYCDMETDGGGWMVFQRRQDGSVDFNRDFTEYREGFGDPNSEFWLGNDILHQLTQGDYELRVDLVDFDGTSASTVYSGFRIGYESYSYMLTLRNVDGENTAGDSLLDHSNMSFSTKDRDNDRSSSHNCAEMYKGGWWYNSCHQANLNGEYLKLNATQSSNMHGIVWSSWKGLDKSLKRSEMKFRMKQ